MSKLARKYLAVQGTLTPAERVISKLGAVLTKRRQSFAAESLAAPIIGAELRYRDKWLICSDFTFSHKILRVLPYEKIGAHRIKAVF